MNLHGNILDIGVAFGAGVLVSFTPCVYPLLPVTAAVVAGANTTRSHWHGFLLSLVYVLGTAVSYSALAVLAALTGKVFGTLQNSPWVLLGVGNILLFFALVMFDVFPLPLLKVASPGGRPRTVGAVLTAGIVSGFVVGPCTAPVLGTLLLYVASKHNVFLGTGLIFVFALGAGMSLLLVGTFSGILTALPRSGKWMEIVRKVAGLVLLAMAEILILRAGALL